METPKNFVHYIYTINKKVLTWRKVNQNDHSNCR